MNRWIKFLVVVALIVLIIHLMVPLLALGMFSLLLLKVMPLL